MGTMTIKKRLSILKGLTLGEKDIEHWLCLPSFPSFNIGLKGLVENPYLPNKIPKGQEEILNLQPG